MTHRTVHVYRDEADEWRWRLTDDNGQIVAVSGEGYEHHLHTVAMAADLFPGVEIVDDSPHD